MPDTPKTSTTMTTPWASPWSPPEEGVLTLTCTAAPAVDDLDPATYTQVLTAAGYQVVSDPDDERNTIEVWPAR
ncbi:hypothetical protein ACFY4C_12740 [Actinomadura viridis]|uniref:hypothetical protein n=1 Tax=Actinomadura viridis TaxID=58110 RepID=UPI0036C5A594